MTKLQPSLMMGELLLLKQGIQRVGHKSNLLIYYVSLSLKLMTGRAAARISTGLQIVKMDKVLGSKIAEAKQKLII